MTDGSEDHCLHSMSGKVAVCVVASIAGEMVKLCNMDKLVILPTPKDETFEMPSSAIKCSLSELCAYLHYTLK